MIHPDQEHNWVTQPARVIATDGSRVTLSTLGATTCHSCSMRKACGQRLIHRMSGCDKSRLTLPYPGSNTPGLADTLQAGQAVILAIPQGIFLRASLLAFLVPLLGLLTGALVMQNLTDSQPFIALAGVGGLGAGLLLMCWRLQHLQDTHAWQPRILSVQDEQTNEVTDK